jgi:hypothetical protein
MIRFPLHPGGKLVCRRANSKRAKRKNKETVMDYEIPESLRLMQETIRRFVNQDLEPLSQQVEDEDHLPEEIVQKMRELGLFGLSIPEVYGGLDLGTFGECLVYEELTKTNAAFRSRIGTSNGIGSMGILLDGTEEQKQKYLPRIASGEWTACLALSEPEAGSDAGNIQTTAERQGETFVINGLKHFITNGDVAHIATVLAVTDKQNRKTHCPIPVRSEHAGRYGHRDLCRPADTLPRTFAAGSRPDGDQGSLHGQTLLHGDGLPGSRSGRPDFRRYGLHEGFSGRAVLPRSPLIPDLGRDKRDPADGYRPGADQGIGNIDPL